MTRRNGHRPAGEAGSDDLRVQRRVPLPSGRAVVGGLLMALAAVGTFLAYAHASTEQTVDVLVASHDLRTGHVITASDVEMLPVSVPDTVRGLFGAADAAVGRVVVAPVDAGEFLLASATATRPEGDESLELALSLPADRIVAGLRPGERVDVFSTWSSDVTELIAVDARVLDVRGGTGGVLESGGTVVVRLAVGDFGQIQALVHAQAAGDITMIRAVIGSEVPSVGSEYHPRSTSPSRAGSDG